MPIPKSLPERADAVMRRWAEKFPHTRPDESFPRGVMLALWEENWTGSEIAEAVKHWLSQGWLDENERLAEAGHDRFWY